MNKWFYAWLHVKHRLEEKRDYEPYPEDFDAKILYSFTESGFKPINTSRAHGKFDKARLAIAKRLEVLREIVKPNLQGNEEWFPYLLGLEAGLMIAEHQLDIIRNKRTF